MGGEIEAAGDVLTGGIIAGTVEDDTGAPAQHGSHGACRNCNAILSGPYCAACGQPAHIHRSLSSLGHDILHGVFHFEGKIWRTIPELFFHPGRLTRRYIAGERAKFISPMALYLFTVFLMFGVFSIIAGLTDDDSGADGDDSTTNLIVPGTGNWKSDVRGSIKETDREIAALREQLDTDDLTPEQRASLEGDIQELETARAAMDALAKGEWSKLGELGKKPQSTPETAPSDSADDKASTGVNINLGWPALDRKLTEGLTHLNDNPGLLLYKMKTNGYKFSWALIPMSVPFVWLLFCLRRDVHPYDHAIFVTYSISFMMLFLILLSIASAVGVSSVIWGIALAFVPPIHLYKQLRGAYGVSRFGAFMRLFLLQISIVLVLVLFSTLLLVLGALD